MIVRTNTISIYYRVNSDGILAGNIIPLTTSKPKECKAKEATSSYATIPSFPKYSVVGENVLGDL